MDVLFPLNSDFCMSSSHPTPIRKAVLIPRMREARANGSVSAKAGPCRPPATDAFYFPGFPTISPVYRHPELAVPPGEHTMWSW